MSLGTVKISDRAVMQLAAHIVQQFDGIKRLENKKENKWRKLLKGDTKGVYIEKTKRGSALEICAVCRFGVNTNDLLSNIKARLHREFEEAGIGFDSVAITISGVEK